MSDTKPASSLYTALLAAQRAMGPVKKDASNPAFRTKYATLQSVLETVEGPLSDNGLVLLQRFTVDGEGPILVTEVVHAESGERITSAVRVVGKDMADPQKVGGAITYYRRYSLLALLGLAPEDDDGNAASKPTPRQQEERPRPAAPPHAAISAPLHAKTQEERPRPAAPPRAPLPAPQQANGREERPDPDQVLAILGEMDEAREPWHELKRYADEQSQGRTGDDALRIHDKLKAIAARRREAGKIAAASIAG